MKIVPPLVMDYKSAAEEKVFELLKTSSLGSGSVALHSLNLPKHEYKTWAEADFVIISKFGIFVLEVKGGGVRCQDGIWEFTNRWGEVHRKSESPFDQARTATFALKSSLEKSDLKKHLKRAVFGWGVVFTDCKFSTDSLEIPKQIVCDSEAIHLIPSFSNFLHNLRQYWSTHPLNKSYEELAGTIINDVCDYLRPSFDKVPSLISISNDTYRKVVRLTDEQYRVIDCLSEEDRIICQGGAGTGKTFLAVESARREIRSGRSVRLVCKSPHLVHFLKSSLYPMDAIINSLDSIISNHSSGQENVPTDTLIIDEAQDLLTLETISVLDKILNGGFNNGRWIAFMDSNNQAAIYGHFDELALQALRHTGAVYLHLKYNCRNTSPIVLQTKLATGADIGIPMIKGSGPPVKIEFCTGSAQMGELLSNQLSVWLSDDIPPEHITILSMCSASESSIAFLPLKFKKMLLIIEDSDLVEHSKGLITFSSIINFKGMENRFVAVADIDANSNAFSISNLYVGMTRANVGLWIGVSERSRSEWERIRRQNVEKLVTLES